MDDALKLAIKAAGGPVSLSRRIGITSQAIAQWRKCPPLRVLDVEKATGVPRTLLRPDIYPDDARKGEAA